MFVKTSLQSFIFDVIDVIDFCFLTNQVKEICQQNRITKGFTYLTLTDTVTYSLTLTDTLTVVRYNFFLFTIQDLT